MHYDHLNHLTIQLQVRIGPRFGPDGFLAQPLLITSHSRQAIMQDASSNLRHRKGEQTDPRASNDKSTSKNAPKSEIEPGTETHKCSLSSPLSILVAGVEVGIKDCCWRTQETLNIKMMISLTLKELGINKQQEAIAPRLTWGECSSYRKYAV